DKIHIYAYKDRFPQEWGGQAYYAGFLIFSPDHKQRTKAGHTETENYTAVVEHELVHVMGMLVRGGFRYVHTWFSEGLAELVSGGTAGGVIEDRVKFEGLLATYGEINPIATHTSQYPDVEMIGFHYFYPMFQLTFRYLTDTDGWGRSLQDARDVWVDMSEGIDFPTAFENRFGLSEGGFEDQFFELIRAYLDGQS
ncbi:MAG: hypothetical protein ACYTFG_19740, partial [Planctomycetota bacterium]